MAKKLVQFLFVIALLLFLAACGNAPSSSSSDTSNSNDSGNEQSSSENSEESGDVIKIGFIAAATGHASSQGKPEADTAKFLEEKINADGGINGKKIDIIEYDTESDETKAVLGMKKLVTQDNVPIVVGGTISGSSLAMLEIAQSEKTPFISMAASAQIVEPVKEYVFKTPQNSNIMVQKTMEFFKENNIKRVAWMHINDAYGEDGYHFFKQMAPEYGVEIVAEETFNATDTTVTPQLSKIKLADPEAVFVWTRPPSGSIVSKNFHQLGFDVPLVHSYGMANNSYLEQAGEAANGNLFAGAKFLVKDELPDSDPQKELFITFTKEYEEKVGYPPTNFSGYAYDGIMLAVEAIKNVGTDREAIRDYLENDSAGFVGISGVFNISPENHSGLGLDSATMIEVQDGTWTKYGK